MTGWRGPEHDRIAAEAELDSALDSGDAARIEAAQAALDEAVAVHEEALAESRREAEAEVEADREDPEPEPLEHRSARLLAFHDQAQAWAWNGNPAAEAAIAEFEAEFDEPEAGL